MTIMASDLYPAAYEVQPGNQVSPRQYEPGFALEDLNVPDVIGKPPSVRLRNFLRDSFIVGGSCVIGIAVGHQFDTEADEALAQARISAQYDYRVALDTAEEDLDYATREVGVIETAFDEVPACLDTIRFAIRTQDDRADQLIAVTEDERGTDACRNTDLTNRDIVDWLNSVQAADSRLVSAKDEMESTLNEGPEDYMDSDVVSNAEDSNQFIWGIIGLSVGLIAADRLSRITEEDIARTRVKRHLKDNLDPNVPMLSRSWPMTRRKLESDAALAVANYYAKDAPQVLRNREQRRHS